MKIIELETKKIIPYEKNPRKNKDAIEKVAESINQFGIKQPIVIDKNNEIIVGHTRFEACKKLGYKKVPVLIADDLSDEQVKAYRLADNKTNEFAKWDFDLLDEELDNIFNIDMENFGFEFNDEQIDWEDETRFRKQNIENLEYAQYDATNKFDIPEIEPVYELPPIKEWIKFSDVLTDKNPQGKAVHFFLDDYKFERVWNNPDKYIDKLKQYVCVASPDFSTFGDMPLALQIYNHYRKHWIGRYWQEHGVNVIPTIRSSTDERSFEWFLDGEPRESIVIISEMWESYEEYKNSNMKEFAIMKKTLKPKKIFVYGASDKTMVEEDDNIEFIENYMKQKFGKEKNG